MTTTRGLPASSPASNPRPASNADAHRPNVVLAHEADIRRVSVAAAIAGSARRRAETDRVHQTHQWQLVRVAGGLDTGQRAQASDEIFGEHLQLLRWTPGARQAHLERHDVRRVVAELDANQSAEAADQQCHPQSTAPSRARSRPPPGRLARGHAARGCRRSRRCRRGARPSGSRATPARARTAVRCRSKPRRRTPARTGRSRSRRAAETSCRSIPGRRARGSSPARGTGERRCRRARFRSGRRSPRARRSR